MKEFPSQDANGAVKKDNEEENHILQIEDEDEKLDPKDFMVKKLRDQVIVRAPGYGYFSKLTYRLNNRESGSSKANNSQ